MTQEARGLHRSGPIPSLNGIRAAALTLVFLAHSGLETIVPGGLGVTIFFVLSGFLITTLLRTEQQRTGRINFRNFYLRRLLRLSPPLLLVIAACALLSGFGIIGGGFSAGGLAAAVLYAGNYFLIFQNFHGMPAGLGVIWSLAIEEHFYLFFPPIAAALLRLRQRRVTLCLLGGLVLLVLAWRLWLASLQAPPTYIDMATDTRIDAILIGCLMALAWNPWLDPVPALGNRGVGWILLSSLGVLGGTLFFRDLFFRETLRYSLQGLAIAPLIYASIARPDLLAFRWLNSRPIAYLGSISYTAYLAHHVILLGIERHWPQSGWTLRLFGAAALTLGVAALIRASVETPLLGLRGRLRGERQSPSAAGTALRTVGQT